MAQRRFLHPALLFFMPTRVEVGSQKPCLVSETSCPEAPESVSGGLGKPVWLQVVFPSPLPTRKGASPLASANGCLPLVSSRREPGSYVSFSDPSSLDLITAGTGDLQKSPFPWVGPTEYRLRTGLSLSRSLGMTTHKEVTSLRG